MDFSIYGREIRGCGPHVVEQNSTPSRKRFSVQALSKSCPAYCARCPRSNASFAAVGTFVGTLQQKEAKKGVKRSNAAGGAAATRESLKLNESRRLAGFCLAPQVGLEPTTLRLTAESLPGTPVPGVKRRKRIYFSASEARTRALPVSMLLPTGILEEPSTLVLNVSKLYQNAILSNDGTCF